MYNAFSHLFSLIILAAALSTSPAAQEEYEYIPHLDDPEAFEETEANLLAGPVGREKLVNFQLNAKVKHIGDGDTVILQGNGGANFSVRLSDMDTPETSHKARPNNRCPHCSIPFRPGQQGGKAATEALMRLISVGDRVVADCYELCTFGRAICHIFKDNINVNLEMIKNGWGRLPRKPSWVRDPQSRIAEEKAKKDRKGSWSLPNQKHPQDWRLKCWREKKCDGAVNWPYEPD